MNIHFAGTPFPLIRKNVPQKWKTTFEMRETTFEVFQNVSNVILALMER